MKATKTNAMLQKGLGAAQWDMDVVAKMIKDGLFPNTQEAIETLNILQLRYRQWKAKKRLLAKKKKLAHK